ncbi:MAG TPA: antibiotic biosynthesis monooxygenase [Chitinophagaceae bacterium]|nr:antibiotic biosynthesis monooxygenase [Chitinophagaceae bacterium]
MITELAVLHIKENESHLFENAFKEAQEIISKMKGYIEHELQKCIEEKNKYILMVRWNTIEDHKEGFRKSKEYNEWKIMLHHFYDPFPVVEYYKKIN